ncbi:unnamed protein product [Urochloa humidicola]
MKLCCVPQLSLRLVHVISRGTITVDIYFNSAKRREALQSETVAVTVCILVEGTDGDFKTKLSEMVNETLVESSVSTNCTIQTYNQQHLNFWKNALPAVMFATVTEEAIDDR